MTKHNAKTCMKSSPHGLRHTTQMRLTDLLNFSVMSFRSTLTLSSGRFLTTSLHRGHTAFCLTSQKRLMHSKQKLCPHGMDAGFLKISRQMLHRNCSSDNTEAMSPTEKHCYRYMLTSTVNCDVQHAPLLHFFTF